MVTRKEIRNHPIYNAWGAMKARCNNPNCKMYKDYGARGIVVCDEWSNDVITFYEWSIANGWQKGLSIDRIDVNGNYCPENCRWATMKVQQRNRRNNRFVTISGETKTVSAWAEEIGVHRGTISRRLDSNRSIEDALSEDRLCPVHHTTLTFMDKTMTIEEWASELNLNRSTIYSRLKRGWTIEKTLTTPSRKYVKL